MTAVQAVVVGSGISGAACAQVLADAHAWVMLVDRGWAPAGRMATRHVGGRAVDTGAGYFTVSDPAFRLVVDDWVARGLARPWTSSFAVAGPDGITGRKDGPVRYAARGGLRSLVEDLLTRRDTVQVAQVESVDSEDDRPRVDGRAVHAVALAMPDAQAARLVDPETLPAVAAAAERPAWDPQLSVAVRYPRRTWDDDLHGVFVNDDDVLAFVADDGSRRDDGAPVLVAHTTPELAARHLEEPRGVVEPVLAALQRVLGVPAGDADVQHVQRWGMSRPSQPRQDVDGTHFWDAETRVGLCGDGWGPKPRVEQAFLSGRALGGAIAEQLLG